MKNWRTNFTGRVKILAAATVLLSICMGAIGADAEGQNYEAAKTMHLQAYSMITKADEFRDNREWGKSLPLYKAAKGIYSKLKKEYPDWKPAMVGSRLQDCIRQVAFIQQMSAAKASADPAVEAPPKKSKTEQVEVAKDETVVEDKKIAADDAPLRELEAANRKLAAKVDNLKSQLEKTENSFREEMRRKMQPLLDENEQLRKQIAELKKQTPGGSGGLNQRIVELTEENVRLNKQLSDTLSKIRTMRSKELDMARMRDRFEKLQAEKDALQAQLAEDEGGVQEKVEVLKELWREKFAEFQAQAEDMRKDLEDERDELKEIVADLKKEGRKKAGRIEQLSAENMQLSERLDEVSDADKALSKKQRQIDALETKIEKQTEKYERQLESQEEKWGKRLDEVRADAEESLSKAEEKIAKLKRDAEAQAEEWQQKLADADKRRDALVEKVEELSESSDKVVSQAAEIAELETELAEAKSDYAAKVEKLTQQWNERLEDAQRDAEKQLVKLEKDFDELKKAARSESENWQDERDELVEVWSDRLAESEKRRETLARKLEGLADSETRMKQQRSEIARLKEAIAGIGEKYKVRLAEQTAAREDKSRQWRAKFEELARKLDTKTEEATMKEQEIAALKEQYEGSEVGELMADMAKTREKYEQTLGMLRESVLKLRDERDIMKSRNFELEGKVMEIRRRFKQLKEKSVK